MTISLSSPVTGGAQTGFTSPTYTLTTDVASDVNGKQWAVTALGGTQVGVTSHAASSPFTWAYYKPKFYRVLGKPNPITGLISNVAKNVHRFNTSKGVMVAAGQPVQTLDIKTEIRVPAGSESYDAANVRGAVSLHVGAVTQISAGWGDTLVTNII